MKTIQLEFAARLCACLSVAAALAPLPGRAQESGTSSSTNKTSSPATEETQKTGDQSGLATIRGRIEGFRHYRSTHATTQPSDEQSDQTLINVRLQDGRSVIISLGAKTNLDDLQLQRNDFIVAEGRAEIVQGVPALATSRIEVNGQRRLIKGSRKSTHSDASHRSASGTRAAGASDKVVHDQSNAAAGSRQNRDAHKSTPSKEAGKRDRAEARQGEDPPGKGAQAQKDPAIDPGARDFLEKVRNAYNNLKTLKQAGILSTSVAGDHTVVRKDLTFTSSYQAPNQFRHETADMIAGSTGRHAFLLNKRTNNYLQQPLDASQGLAGAIPPGGLSILHSQDPSLLAAIMQNPFQRVFHLVDSVEKAHDVSIDGRHHPQLVLRGTTGHGKISILFDPDSHLARRITADLQPSGKSGEDPAQGSRTVIEYTTINTQPNFQDNTFAWQPPADATNVAQQRVSEQQSAQGLVGKDAPAFELNSLDGNRISLGSLKGKVVVLDFWASWCPPCRESLPHLGKLFQDKKQQDVDFFAINVGEEKDRVQAFLRAQNVSVPVLLDPDGKTAREYQVEGIPKTVVIGPDGKIKQVFVGLGDDSYQQIREAIAHASAASGKVEDDAGPAANGDDSGE